MEDLLKRKENETELDYHKRITLNKKEYDIDFVEWGDILLKEDNNYASENLRKAYYVFEKYFKRLDDRNIENITDEKILKEIELRKIELEKERKKIQTTKIEYNKMLREKSREELIIEELKSSIESVIPPTFSPILKVNDRTKEYVLSFGDIHYDKFFESVNNSYSIEEVHRRFQVLLEEVIEIIYKENISKLTIVNCGDNLEGLLRASALKSLRVGMLESVVQFSRFMAEWLNELSKYVMIDYLHVPTANHGEVRLFNQKARQTDENLERVIVNYIHDLLKDNERINVPITTDKNYVDFEILGYNFIALHGDGLKGIKNSLKDLSLLHRKFYDFVVMGHYHNGMETTVAEGETNNMEVLVIPSIVGSDPYSDSLMVGSKSSAKLFVFEENKGHTQSYNIILN
ncbi:hypothetical protein [Clostridium sp.]|uniref:hypothetical protein n=1 Tax=Clostridium sp. TaxID=1506 RepID=UPI0026208C95|nr:hypothetical protein [Clostridium sp.]